MLIMYKVLLATFLLTTPVLANDPPLNRELTGSEICDAVAQEIEEAVKFGIINKQEASDILIRCYVNYS